jgi:hypothetical protein
VGGEWGLFGVENSVYSVCDLYLAELTNTLTRKACLKYKMNWLSVMAAMGRLFIY